MLEKNVAPGVHRVEDAYTNWYLVEADDDLTVVDAGVPSSWSSLQEALGELGRKPDDIKALILTHAHFDHIGFAERLRREWGVPVYVHENDVPLARHPHQYAHERPRSLYMASRPEALPIVLSFLKTRAFWPRPLRHGIRFEDGSLPVPGSPRVIATPGHTIGHVSFHFQDRDALIAGDAVVTLDPYTAKSGPRLVARAATADPERAGRSLTAIAETSARTVLPGHGAPWKEGADAIAEGARRAGAA
jgi:glyoxylase-like metal-dependent hydrolase (beta-lactamase superfamily II)